jgi:hypothetical protein
MTWIHRLFAGSSTRKRLAHVRAEIRSRVALGSNDDE